MSQIPRAWDPNIKPLHPSMRLLDILPSRCTQTLHTVIRARQKGRAQSIDPQVDPRVHRRYFVAIA